jgi:ABC-type uncharacterized transport system auxiliary subunit
VKRIVALLLTGLLAACVSVDVGKEPAAQVMLSLRDASISGVARRAQPLVPALLVQPQPGNALADTQQMAYSRHADEYRLYQYATWVDRPVRQIPRLLQQRLDARGTAAAVALAGDPQRADWLLTVAVDTLHHDVSTTPGMARLGLALELFDRRARMRIASRSFSAAVPVEREDSAAAAQALSTALARVFDEATPWVEAELQRASASAR